MVIEQLAGKKPTTRVGIGAIAGDIGFTGRGQRPLQLLRWPEEWGEMPEAPWTRPTGIAPEVRGEWFTTPEIGGWGFTEDFGMFLSPQGEQFTLAEAQTRLVEMGFSALAYDYSRNLFVPTTEARVKEREEFYRGARITLAEIGEPGFVGPPITPGAISIEEYQERIGDYEALVLEQREALSSVFEAVFPGQTIDDLFEFISAMTLTGEMDVRERAFANQLQDEFLGTIKEVGRTTETELLLRTVFPSATEDDMGILLGEEAPFEEIEEPFIQTATLPTGEIIALSPATGEWEVLPIAPELQEPAFRVAETALEPFRRFGTIAFALVVASPEIRAELKARTEERRKAFEDPSLTEDKRLELIQGHIKDTNELFKVGGLLRDEFEKLPLWQQLLLELPAWLLTGVVSGTSLRASLAPIAAKGGARGVAAQTARGILLPVEAVEVAITAPIRLTILGTKTALNKSFDIAFNAGLDRWIATYGRVDPRYRTRLQNLIISNRSWLIERATQNLVRRQAERKGVQYAASKAAGDTLKDVEPLLLQAAKDAGVAAKPVAPGVVPPVKVVEPIKPTEVLPITWGKGITDANKGRVTELVNDLPPSIRVNVKGFEIDTGQLATANFNPDTGVITVNTPDFTDAGFYHELMHGIVDSAIKRGDYAMLDDFGEAAGITIEREPTVKPLYEESLSRMFADYMMDKPLPPNINTFFEKWFPTKVIPKPPITPKPEVIPPTELVVEGVPEKVVYTEAGYPVRVDESIPQTVVANTPIIEQIGAKEFVRGTRHVFEKVGLREEIYEPATEAETLIYEERQAFRKAADAVRKRTSKKPERDILIFREANEPGSQVGLTFEEKRAVNHIREWANTWADRKNLPPEKRITNYIPHLFEQEMERQLVEEGGLDPAIAYMMSKTSPAKITDPFLKERLGALGFKEDPWAAMEAYNAVALRVHYYDPLLKKIKTMVDDPQTPTFTRKFLQGYADRMTGAPTDTDKAINITISQFAEKIKNLPLGKQLYPFLTRGNPSGMAAYNLTSTLYALFLGFKPTSAIRNLSQNSLTIAEVGPVAFAKGLKLRASPDAVRLRKLFKNLRSRKMAFTPGLDSSFISRFPDAVVKKALWLFRGADHENVENAAFAGYADARDRIPEADESWWIKRGDEVLADTQYLYTKMNSYAFAQSGPGRVLSMLTTWTENWIELMVKWISRRPSYVYQAYEKETGNKVPGKNWSQTYKAVGLYLTIVGLGYLIKEKTRLKAWEYTGITSLKYLAGVVGGEFPALQATGAVMDTIIGFLTDDERMLKSGLNQLQRTFTPGIIKQLEDVASGDKDWLTLLFYLEGRDIYIERLKSQWEKGWKEYEAIEKAKERDDYRKANPLIEAQMFITSKFTTLSTEEARQEVLRIIEENNLDTELIKGYEKVFGVDTNKEFKKNKNLLGTVELDEEGEQKLKENGELDYYTTSNFASDVNALEKVVGRYKIEKDGNPLAIEYLQAKDLFVQYDSLTEDDARALYRQQFPDVEALMYLWGHKNIKSFKNPKSALILLDLMEKYNIPPESVPAFLDNPEKYDELFTQKFALELNTYELDNQYENYGNLESDLYIEDADARKEARALLKENNPQWMADSRRIEAIDHDATPGIIEGWADRGKVIDEHGASSAEGKVWLLDNPEVHKWALDNELLTDDGTEWNEPILRLQKQWASNFDQYDAFGDIDSNTYIADDDIRAEARQRLLYSVLPVNTPGTLTEFGRAYYTNRASSEGYSEENWDKYVALAALPDWGSWRERYLLDNRDFYAEYTNKEIGDHTIITEDKVKPIERDRVYGEFYSAFQKWDDTGGMTEEQVKIMHEGLFTDSDFKEAYYRVAAYDDYIAPEFIDEYVEWYFNDGFPKPSGYKFDVWYEDDWWLMEHDDFVDEMVSKELWSRKDFDNVPSREVFDKYLIYLSLPLGSARMGYRIENPDLDAWGQVVKGWKPATGEPKEILPRDVELAQKLAEIKKGGQILPVFRG